jgi:hypothetical protein
MRETTVFTILLMLYLSAMSHLARSLHETKERSKDLTAEDALDEAEQELSKQTSNKWEP